jgi:hypothetical protein
MTSTTMRVNLEDYLGLPVFVIAVAVSLGLLDSTMMGLDLGATLLDLGSDHGFSVANTLAIATLGYVAYSNEWDRGAMSGVQMWIVLATVGFLIAPPFLPVLENTLAQQPAAIAALVVQVGGYMTFSYIG